MIRSSVLTRFAAVDGISAELVVKGVHSVVVSVGVEEVSVDVNEVSVEEVSIDEVLNDAMEVVVAVVAGAVIIR